MGRLWIGGVAIAASLFAAPSRAAEDCRTSLMPPASVTAEKRLIELEDLVQLRDIGPAQNGFQRATIFTVSPDKTTVAFQIRRADPTRNDYCVGMFVADISGRKPVRVVDIGGEAIPRAVNSRGFVESRSGHALAITPKFSPDGRWIAYLRKDGRYTQLWRADVAGAGAHPLTDLPFDVVDFEWLADGEGLIFSEQEAVDAARRQQDAQGTEGYVFDDRFIPYSGSRPKLRGTFAPSVRVLDIASGKSRIATAEEAAPLSPAVAGPAGALSAFSGPWGEAWTEKIRADDISSPTRLVAHLGKRKASCTLKACGEVTSVWPGRTGELIFLSRDPSRGEVSFYLWRPGRSAPVPRLTSPDVFLNCAGIDSIRLVCARETSLRPRHLVVVDLETGRVDPFFDPNPEFASLELGPAERLMWKNDYGIDSYGDLVLPPRMKAGEKAPLIVVGYTTRGFLRGGVGDDVPIQYLASKGYAVLSYAAPADYGVSNGAKTWDEASRMERTDWIGFRSVQSSIERGIDIAIARGVVDPEKLGLTGVSFGSTVAQLTLVNSQRFKAAMVTNCCEEAASASYLAGPVLSADFVKWGYPSVLRPDDAYWRPISLRMNAKCVSTPLLMQLADQEYLDAVESFAALKEAGQPVEMVIYPDEYHVRWHPRHRLTTYRRTTDWFDFWLRGLPSDRNEAATAQTTRWQALKAAASRTERCSG